MCRRWTSWPGLQTTIDVPADDNLVLITYQTASGAANTHVLSKMYIDGVEQVGTRSIAGNTVYGSNLGIFLGALSAGSHSLDVKYRTPGTGIHNNVHRARATRIVHRSHGAFRSQRLPTPGAPPTTSPHCACSCRCKDRTGTRAR